MHTNAPASPSLHPPDQAARLRALVGEIVAQGPHAHTATLPRVLQTPDTASRVQAARKAAVIAVASGKGGVGKTNLAVNLAVAFAQRGRRAVLLDADLGLGNADVICGLSPRRNLVHRLSGDADLADITLDAPAGFRLVPGASGVASMADLPPHRRDDLLRDLAVLESDCDLLILDCGAGIGRSVLMFLAASESAMIVTTPEPTAITDAYALIKCLRADPAPTAGPSISLVVNQARDLAEASSVHARIEQVCSRFLGFSPALAGGVRLDPAVPSAVRDRTPLLLHAPRCRASEDVRVIADYAAGLCGLTVPTSSRPRGLVARLLRPLTSA